MPSTQPSASAPDRPSLFRRSLALPRLLWHAADLVWQTDRRQAIGLMLLSALTGVLPAGVAYLSKLLMDAVAGNQATAPRLLAGMLVMIALLLGAQRLLGVCDALLRVRLSQRVLEQVLTKALSLPLADFEAAEIHDQLRLVREQATERPLNLARRALIALQQGFTLASMSALLLSFSPWLPLLLVVAALPALWVELRFNADAFRLFRAHSPDARRQAYLETLLTREDFAKEVKASGVGAQLLARHRAIFERFFREDRALTLRRAAFGFALGVVSVVALGAALWWVTLSALRGETSVGTLTLLLIVLKQAQSSSSDLLSVLAGMHEDNLYLATLHAFLARPTPSPGTMTTGPKPGDGVRFEKVSFTYPGAATPALVDVSFHLPPGTKLSVIGDNGAGKTTLLKLLIGLYQPTSGRVMLDGRALDEWSPEHRTERLAVMFQDFARYQLTAGENIGIGHPAAFADRSRWQEAARATLLHDVLTALPNGYDTPLGHWFEGGRELSLGEWQRVAVARLLTRTSAEIFVLDEPTASLDASAEQLVLDLLDRATTGRTAVLISHRATWRSPHSLVLELERGRVVRVNGIGAPGVP